MELNERITMNPLCGILLLEINPKIFTRYGYTIININKNNDREET